MAKILYLSYDGMTDPLGQSQVIPYLIGLSKKGHEFHIISSEKKKNFSEQEKNIQQLLESNNIHWHPVLYSKNPPIISTLWDIFQLKAKALQIHKKENFSIIHCRSYITSLIGLWMKKKFSSPLSSRERPGMRSGVKFIFDMRGFWADERVEGKIWNLKNPLYKIIYTYFKKKETEFLSVADHTVSLTEKAKQIIHAWATISNQPIPITVIPCCADTELFSLEKINEETKIYFKNLLKISNDDFILSYLGAIGSWYLLDEMLMFFKTLLKSKPNSKFLFITPENPKSILLKAVELNISAEKIIIQKAKRKEVPLLLSLSNVSVFFIKPCFSKKASSPVKMGEIMAMGIPVICNSGVGDVEQIINQTNAGILINQFNETDFNNVVKQLDELMLREKKHIREKAKMFFSLENGVELYNKVYLNLTEKEIYS